MNHFNRLPRENDEERARRLHDFSIQMNVITLTYALDPPFYPEDIYDRISLDLRGVTHVRTPTRWKKIATSGIDQENHTGFHHMLQLTYRKSSEFPTGKYPCYIIKMFQTGRMVITFCQSREEFERLMMKIQEVFRACGYTLSNIRDIKIQHQEKA